MAVNRREQLCIFVKHEDFGYHELNCVQRWVRFIREGSEAHVFKDSEYKEERGEVAIVYFSLETSSCTTT